MALCVGENINLDFSVIINNLFSTKYPIDILDLTKQLKGLSPVHLNLDLESLDLIQSLYFFSKNVKKITSVG